jgi:hypothetical protein
MGDSDSDSDSECRPCRAGRRGADEGTWSATDIEEQLPTGIGGNRAESSFYDWLDPC